MSDEKLGMLPGEFEVFYRETVQTVLRSARRMTAGDAHAAHDVTQEAYLEMFKRWCMRRHAATDENLKYVIGIAGNKVKQMYRKQSRYMELMDGLEIPASDPSADEILRGRLLGESIVETIDRQPLHRRLTAVLYIVHGMNYMEIASALEIAPSTARTQMERMRAVFKVHLSRNSGDDDVKRWRDD